MRRMRTRSSTWVSIGLGTYMPMAQFNSKASKGRYWAQVARRGRTQVGDRQALLQLDLRPDLGQHLLNQVSRLRQAGLAGLLVGSRTRELFKLRMHRLL